MKRIKGKIDVSTWDLDTAEKISELLKPLLCEAVAEVLNLAFNDDDTSAYFPAEWGKSDGNGGPKVDDALTIYFCPALDNGYEDTPIWKTSINEMLSSTIDICKEDGSFSEGLKRIRDALLELADRIGDALPSNAK